MSAASSSLVCGVATKIGGFFPQHATNKLKTAPVHHRAKGRMSTLTCRAAVECDVSQLKTAGRPPAAPRNKEYCFFLLPQRARAKRATDQGVCERSPRERSIACDFETNEKPSSPDIAPPPPPPLYEQGMVHFGVGGFHRSHQQVFMDELMRAHFDETKHWAYTGVGVLPGDAHMRDYLIKNNFSYPVVSREGKVGGEARKGRAWQARDHFYF